MTAFTCAFQRIESQRFELRLTFELDAKALLKSCLAFLWLALEPLFLKMNEKLAEFKAWVFEDAPAPTPASPNPNADADADADANADADADANAKERRQLERKIAELRAEVEKEKAHQTKIKETFRQKETEAGSSGLMGLEDMENLEALATESQRRKEAFQKETLGIIKLLVQQMNQYCQAGDYQNARKDLASFRKVLTQGWFHPDDLADLNSRADTVERICNALEKKAQARQSGGSESDTAPPSSTAA